VLAQPPVLADQGGAVCLDVLEPGAQARNLPLTSSVPGGGSSCDGHETAGRIVRTRSPPPELSLYPMNGYPGK